MYLSQLVLDPMDRRVMRALADVYRLHQLAMGGFAEHETPSRVLFRVEPELHGREVRLLVQSHDSPEWSSSADGTVVRASSKEFAPDFPPGARFRFRLRANPVVTRNGKRFGLVREEALLHWLRNKEEQIGARFGSVSAVDEGYLTGTRKRAGGTDRVNIKAARFDGFLAVTDGGRFAAAQRAGIGPAKAFGCGLLSLARA